MANTPNLGLHQWSASDAFLREDFNEDLLKLDKALRCKTGSYTGNGAANRVIDVGARPKLVILMGQIKSGNYTHHCMLHVTESHVANMQGGDLSVYTQPSGYVTRTESGFTLAQAGLNAAGISNSYVVFY